LSKEAPPSEERCVMERCWHGKFSGSEQCADEGRYGNPEYRADAGRHGLNATLKFMRAARWCAAHKHPDDRLLELGDTGASPLEGARPADGDLAS
jgi:hypothetical protein